MALPLEAVAALFGRGWRFGWKQLLLSLEEDAGVEFRVGILCSIPIEFRFATQQHTGDTLVKLTQNKESGFMQ